MTGLTFQTGNFMKVSRILTAGAVVTATLIGVAGPALAEDTILRT